MKTTFIYALICPNIKQIRYIGKSDNPQKRLKEHFRFTEEYNCPKNIWLKELKRNGVFWEIEIEILDEVDYENWLFWENYYISLYKSWGFNLTNQVPFYVYTDEIKLKLSNSMKGVKRSDDTKIRMSLSRKGLKLSEETKIKIGNANRGKRWKISEEARLKLKDRKPVLLRKKHTEEAKNKMSQAKKGKPGIKHSDETKNKISIANTGKRWKHSPEALEKMKGRKSWNEGLNLSDETKKKISDKIKEYSREHSFNRKSTIYIIVNGIKTPLLFFMRKIGHETKTTYYNLKLKQGKDITGNILNLLEDKTTIIELYKH